MSATPQELLRARATRTIITPEGVPLELQRASVLLRALAFGLDVGVIATLALIMVLVALLASITFRDGGWTLAALGVSTFVLRHLYFPFFEIRWRGRTPAKRLLGLRVIDGHGATLSAEAVFIRNLMRDVELTIPLMLLIWPVFAWSGAPILVRLLCVVWALLWLCVPLIHRDRLRLGDMAAGTLVVREPPRQQLRELSAAEQRADSRFDFTTAQLDMYGIYELQVLEDFLNTAPAPAALLAVAEKVAHKIAWPDDRWQHRPHLYLTDFYRALRARREQQLLLGQRQESKKEGALGEP